MTCETFAVVQYAREVKLRSNFAIKFTGGGFAGDYCAREIGGKRRIDSRCIRGVVDDK